MLFREFSTDAGSHYLRTLKNKQKEVDTCTNHFVERLIPLGPPKTGLRLKKESLRDKKVLSVFISRRGALKNNGVLVGNFQKTETP